jgi:hypothetical protein
MKKMKRPFFPASTESLLSLVVAGAELQLQEVVEWIQGDAMPAMPTHSSAN